MTACPKCGYASEGTECPACGVIFAKLAARAAGTRIPCPKCGYPSEGTECLSCGVIFAKLAAQAARPAPPLETRPFNAQFLSALTPDRQYRVYCKPGLIYLIRFAGQPLDLSGVARRLGGFIGEAIYNGLTESDDDRARKLAELDRKDPEALMPHHEHNLRISLAEVVRSTLEAPPLMGGAHGAHVGRWTLELSSGKPMLFQLPTECDGELAEPQLTVALGTRLTRKARWNADKGVFVRA